MTEDKISKQVSVCHLYNLANVAYGYGKILDEFGVESHVYTHDTNHLMSQPEWDDIDLNAEDFPDENNFYNNTADLGGYERPVWFNEIQILDVWKVHNDYSESLFSRGFNAFNRVLTKIWKVFPESVKRVTRPTLRTIYYEYFFSILFRFKHGVIEDVEEAEQPKDSVEVSDVDNFEKHGDLIVSRSEKNFFKQSIQRYRSNIKTISKESQQYGNDWILEEKFLATYIYHAFWHDCVSQNSKIVFAYVLTPIYAMIAGSKPFVAIEIGTLREIPFQGDQLGRALAMAYRKSNKVIITNPDVKAQADILGLGNYAFCPHPYNGLAYKRSDGRFETRNQILSKYEVDTILFCPARQNWRLKGNDKYLLAFSKFLQKGYKAVMIIPGWGQEIDRSKKYCNKLGISDSVIWIKPQSESSLSKYYQASDFVLDQFQLGVFGLTTPKALACGAVVLTSYSHDINKWCFPTKPPVQECDSAQEICDNLVKIVGSDELRESIVHEGISWMDRFHSGEVISRKLESIISEVLTN